MSYSKSVVQKQRRLFLTKPNPRFMSEFASFYAYADSVALEGCGTEIGIKRTEEDGCVQPYQRRCKNPKCPICATARKEEQVADIAKWVSDFYNRLNTIALVVLMATFTVPKDIGERIRTYKDVEDLRKIAWSVVSDVFGGYGGQKVSVSPKQKKVNRYLLAGWPAPQFWPSYYRTKPGNVFKGAHWHVHVPFLNVKFDRLGSMVALTGPVEGTFEEIRVGWSYKEYAALMAWMAQLWTERIEARFGKSSFVADGKVGPHGFESHWDVNLEWADGVKGLKKYLLYAFRGPIQDAYREVVYNRTSPSQEQYDAFERNWSMFYHKKAWASAGWIQDSVRNDYLAKVGLSLEPRKERVRELRRTFCKHGFEFKVDRFEAMSWEDAESCGLVTLTVDKSGGWMDGRGG